MGLDIFRRSHGKPPHFVARLMWQFNVQSRRPKTMIHSDLGCVNFRLAMIISKKGHHYRWILIPFGGKNLEKNSRKTHPLALNLILFCCCWIFVDWRLSGIVSSKRSLNSELLKEIMTCAKKPFSDLYQFICSFLVCHSAKMRLIRRVICCIYSFIFMFEIPFHPSHPFRGPIGFVFDVWYVYNLSKIQ